MNRINILVLAVMMVVVFSAANLQAEEIKGAGSLSADVMSNYVWRGMKLSNSWVVQPSAGITYGVFGANLWSNYDSDAAIDEGDGHGESNETDLTLTYTRSMDKLTLGAGYIFYALAGANDTQELYLSASYATVLNPTLTVYYDFDEGDGAFAVAAVSHSVEIMKDTSLKLGASASYNLKNKVMGRDKNGEEFSNLYNGELSASVTFPVMKAIAITPKVAYSVPLSSDAKEAIKNLSNDNDNSVFYGGINLTLSF
jgi:hypothetical protein